MKSYKLSIAGSLSLVIGNIIGVGIFTTTGYLSNHINSGYLLLFAWLLGGLYALAGATVYGVLSKKYPLSGGDYRYLSKEIHPVLGYLFGWSAFFITYTGSIAALSIGAVYYFSATLMTDFQNLYIFSFHITNIHIGLNLEKIIAILLVMLFTYTNYRGLKLSGRNQIVLTALIVVFMIFLVTAGLFSKNSVAANINEIHGKTSLENFFVALIAVLFTYSGWTSIVYIAEEVENPKRTLYRVMLLGVAFVTILYILINVVYLSHLKLPEMRNVINITSKTATSIWGESFAQIISGFIFIAILSTLNSTILSGARIFRVMSTENYFRGYLKEIHPKYMSPHKSLYAQAGWSIVLILSGSFNQLLSFVIFMIVIFSILAGFISLKIAFFELKKVKWLTIIITFFYIVFCALIAFSTLLQKTSESLVGIGFMIIALLFYMREIKTQKS